MSSPYDFIADVAFAELAKFEKTHGRPPNSYEEIDAVQESTKEITTPRLKEMGEALSDDDVDWKEA